MEGGHTDGGSQEQQTQEPVATPPQPREPVTTQSTPITTAQPLLTPIDRLNAKQLVEELKARGCTDSRFLTWNRLVGPRLQQARQALAVLRGETPAVLLPPPEQRFYAVWHYVEGASEIVQRVVPLPNTPPQQPPEKPFPPGIYETALGPADMLQYFHGARALDYQVVPKLADSSPNLAYALDFLSQPRVCVAIAYPVAEAARPYLPSPGTLCGRCWSPPRADLETHFDNTPPGVYIVPDNDRWPFLRLKSKKGLLLSPVYLSLPETGLPGAIRHAEQWYRDQDLPSPQTDGANATKAASDYAPEQSMRQSIDHGDLPTFTTLIQEHFERLVMKTGQHPVVFRPSRAVLHSVAEVGRCDMILALLHEVERRMKNTMDAVYVALDNAARGAAMDTADPENALRKPSFADTRIQLSNMYFTLLNHQVGNGQRPIDFAIANAHWSAVGLFRTAAHFSLPDGSSQPQLGQGVAEASRRLASASSGRWYVPVLARAEEVAELGSPWSPEEGNAREFWSMRVGGLERGTSIQALAGPLPTKEDAEAFYELWNDAGRGREHGVDDMSKLFSQLKIGARAPTEALGGDAADLRRSDPAKGWEQVGRALARLKQIEWEEYWPSLDCMADLSTLEGLGRWEAYLKFKADRFCGGTLPSYDDVDAFLAAHEEPSLAESLKPDGPGWPHASAFPRVWGWAMYLQAMLDGAVVEAAELPAANAPALPQSPLSAIQALRFATPDRQATASGPATPQRTLSSGLGTVNTPGASIPPIALSGRRRASVARREDSPLVAMRARVQRYHKLTPPRNEPSSPTATPTPSTPLRGVTGRSAPPPPPPLFSAMFRSPIGVPPSQIKTRRFPLDTEAQWAGPAEAPLEAAQSATRCPSFLSCARLNACGKSKLCALQPVVSPGTDSGVA